MKRVDYRRVLNSIFWRLRTGAPRADVPARYGPHTTCVNRFNRWRRAVCARILEAVSTAYGSRPVSTAAAVCQAASDVCCGVQCHGRSSGTGRVIGDARQHVSEPSLRIDVVELRGLDQRVKDGGTLAAAIRAAEQPRLAAQRHAAERPLGRVVREADAAIVKEAGDASQRRSM